MNRGITKEKFMELLSSKSLKGEIVNVIISSLNGDGSINYEGIIKNIYIQNECVTIDWECGLLLYINPEKIVVDTDEDDEIEIIDIVNSTIRYTFCV